MQPSRVQKNERHRDQTLVREEKFIQTTGDVCIVASSHGFQSNLNKHMLGLVVNGTYFERSFCETPLHFIKYSKTNNLIAIHEETEDDTPAPAATCTLSFLYFHKNHLQDTNKILRAMQHSFASFGAGAFLRPIVTLLASSDAKVRSLFILIGWTDGQLF